MLYFLQPAERMRASFLFIEAKAVDEMELEQDKIKKLKSEIAEAREICKQKRRDLSVKQKEMQEAKDKLKKLEGDLLLTYEHSQALQSDSFRQATPVNRRSIVFYQVSAAASTSSFGQANQHLTLQEAADSATNIAQRSDHEQVILFSTWHVLENNYTYYYMYDIVGEPA